MNNSRYSLPKSVEEEVNNSDVLSDVLLNFSFKATLANLINGFGGEALAYDSLMDYVEAYIVEEEVDAYYLSLLRIVGDAMEDDEDSIEKIGLLEDEDYQDYIELVWDRIGDLNPFALAYAFAPIVDDEEDEDNTILDWLVANKSKCNEHVKKHKNMVCEQVVTTKMTGTPKVGFMAVNPNAPSQKGTAPSQRKGHKPSSANKRTEDQIKKHRKSMKVRAKMKKKKEERRRNSEATKAKATV